MKQTMWVWVLVLLVTMASWSGAETVTVAGVQLETPVQLPPPGVPAKAELGSNELDEEFINFDDTDAPSLFNDAIALTDEYAGQGVIFQGMGEVLNYQSSFGVSGYSSPNFLAFNTGAAVPGPETMLFDPPVDMVSVLAGSANAGTITLAVYDESGDLIDEVSGTGVNDLQPFTITTDQLIHSAVISFTGEWLVVDDLTFDPDTTPPPVVFNLHPTTTVIPPNGGTVVYDVELTSNIGATYPGIQYWTMVTLPNGQQFGPLMTVPFTLTPFMDVFVVGATQVIPALAPAGTYTFMGYVGIPNVQFLEDSFEFEKIGAAATGVEGWGNTFPASKASLR